MAWIATLTRVSLEGSTIVLAISFSEEDKTLTKEFRYDVRESDLSLASILKQVEAIKAQLAQKTSLFQQLKAREGQVL